MLKHLSLWPFLIIFFLSGCSYFSGAPTIKMRNKEYLSANSIAPLKIPSDLSSTGVHNNYPIPNLTNNNDKTVSLVPPGL